jgi:hypothetical protein
MDNDTTKRRQPMLLAEDYRDDEELFRRALPKSGFENAGQSKTEALSRYL